MFNRCKILSKAWAEYRFQMKWRDNKAFDRALFGRILRDHWAYARADLAAARERAAEDARLAAASQLEQRTAAIRSELRDMEMGDFINWGRRAALASELETLRLAS